MLEEELKFDVNDSFVLPALAGLIGRSGKTLTATYYDTGDLRLIRAGASLRYRVGDDLPWTVKLATDIPGVRNEVSMAGPPGRPPTRLRWLVASLTRGMALRKVAVVHSERRRHELLDADGTVLAEIADDTVTSGEVSFREIEVERKAGSRKLLSIVERDLVDAGARRSQWPSKLARALGAPALRAPDLVPGKRFGKSPTAADVVTAAVRRGAERVLAHDPLVRLGDLLPDGDTPVHQMRVGCRRLRSDLKTFKDLVHPGWAARLRGELGWLAGLLGAARDAEVLRERLHRTAAADPLAPMDPEAVAHIDASLARRHDEALEALDRAMRTRRYVALVELLTVATQEIPFTKRAKRPLSLPVDGGLEAKAGALTLDAPDEQWHEVRILAKRARYAAEAVSGRGRLARELAAVQELLGEHQDGAVAAQTWLSFADDPAIAVTAGRLYERERAAIRKVRERFLALRQSPAG